MEVPVPRLEWPPCEGRHSRAVLAEPLWKGGLEQLVQFTTRRSETANMRRLLVDMIEECVLRHVGHADSIRESVDGLVGEDPPR